MTGGLVDEDERASPVSCRRSADGMGGGAYEEHAGCRHSLGGTGREQVTGERRADGPPAPLLLAPPHRCTLRGCTLTGAPRARPRTSSPSRNGAPASGPSLSLSPPPPPRDPTLLPTALPPCALCAQLHHRPTSSWCTLAHSTRRRTPRARTRPPAPRLGDRVLNEPLAVRTSRRRYGATAGAPSCTRRTSTRAYPASNSPLPRTTPLLTLPLVSCPPCIIAPRPSASAHLQGMGAR